MSHTRDQTQNHKQRERLDKKIQETRRGDERKPNTKNQILITQNLNPQSIKSHNMITNQTTKP